MRTYPPEAIEQCQRLFIRFNGKRYDLIEKEMRKTWPGWSKKNLEDRGDRMGWVEKYGFKKALAISITQRPTAALNSAQQLVIEVETVRAQLFSLINAQGANVDKEKLQLHRDYCKLHIEALTRVEAAKDTLGGFVNNWERLVDWAVDIDPKLARMLIKYSDPILARAEGELGETADMNGNANSAGAATNAGAED